MTTVCLTFDFDAVSIWVSTFKHTTASPVSRGEFGARVGIYRILDLLSRKGVMATFFVPGHTAANFPEPVHRILQERHEIAVHGYCHETPVGLSREEEFDLLERSIAKLRSTLGEGFYPVGYRSPAWDLSPHSIEFLERLGFRYDSSMMADDFRPYHPRRGDHLDHERFVRGPETRLIEFPVAWELDDYPYFHFMSKPINQGLRSTAEVLSIWREEFDYCHSEVADGVFTLTIHPEICGRGPRVQMLSQLIDHMRGHGGVRFSTLADEARRRLAELDSAVMEKPNGSRSTAI
jgi:peptidoglycan/xylan/chitin deacetylase (PgdA/CDA1 family)